MKLEEAKKAGNLYDKHKDLAYIKKKLEECTTIDKEIHFETSYTQNNIGINIPLSIVSKVRNVIKGAIMEQIDYELSDLEEELSSIGEEKQKKEVLTSMSCKGAVGGVVYFKNPLAENIFGEDIEGYLFQYKNNEWKPILNCPEEKHPINQDKDLASVLLDGCFGAPFVIPNTDKKVIPVNPFNPKLQIREFLDFEKTLEEIKPTSENLLDFNPEDVKDKDIECTGELEQNEVATIIRMVQEGIGEVGLMYYIDRYYSEKLARQINEDKEEE